jgi:hypothetical protein
MPIDPSISALTAAGLPGSLFSFGMPCLKWKLVGGFKTHWGWTGFDATISPPNRYLTRTVVYTVMDTYLGETSTKVTTSQENMDRISGAVTGQSPPGGTGPIGGGAPVVYNGDTRQTTDTGPRDLGGGYIDRQIWQVTYSNQYTMGQLESDADSLIDGFDPSSVPNQTITALAYPTDGNPTAGCFATFFPPGRYAYPQLGHSTFGTPMPAPTLGAAAIAGYAPANQFLQSFGTAGFGKIVGYLAMAGDYCLKTYTVDAGGQFIGSPTCLSGRGSCSSWFRVAPPAPYATGRNTYVVAVPNCQCGN